MTKSLLCILFCLFAITAFAQTQKLPLQGRLFEDNKPVNGSRDFKFSIAALSWVQSLSGVQVNEGLYAVELDIPTTLFMNMKSHDLRIEVNGTLLSTVKIHAPVESDPSVPANLKDGVSWLEVTNKPVQLDMDTTNELQELKLTGNVLSISKGNSVEINLGSSGNMDTLTVGAPVKKNVVASESSTSGESTTKSTAIVRQFFVSGSSGRLLSIEVECANIDGLGAEIRLFEDSLGTQAIMLNSFAGNAFMLSSSFKAFTPPNASVFLKENKTYVFQISVIGGDYVFRVRKNGYLFGDSNLGEEFDLNFRINVEATIGPSFKVDSLGRVGIGTDLPTSTLSVNGRIEDKTGFVMPVGTIISWAGPETNPPKGWLVCNGDSVSRAVYTDLFSVIGENWGAGNGKTTFHLPDLRGEFLRGWSGNTNNDPDNSNRINKFSGGKMGNKVGTYQLDENKTHNHQFGGNFINKDGNQIWNGYGTAGTKVNGGRWIAKSNNSNAYWSTKDSLTSSEGGAETRPRNASVLFIIKY